MLIPSSVCCSCIVNKQIIFHRQSYVTAKHGQDFLQHCGIISPLIAHPSSGIMAGRSFLSNIMVYHGDNRPEDGAGASPWSLHLDQCMGSTTPSALGKKRRRCKDGNGLLGLCVMKGKEMMSFPKKAISRVVTYGGQVSGWICAAQAGWRGFLFLGRMPASCIFAGFPPLVETRCHPLSNEKGSPTHQCIPRPTCKGLQNSKLFIASHMRKSGNAFPDVKQAAPFIAHSLREASGFL